ncbi:hypothetical protein BABINDRAFT_132774 [Babjeviella inositovora NRRL Y-12698]|uniref:Retrograde transport protein Dsl1 C-terminal domain-containing protein n=1 Tax=Babjeviella inositovora NRRL Y-12698 TaxID=984486 RepID=A0A1E3QRV6_9ASCO|nr:uncharacterized protein BABINDRAFT_132774 [Babjeviella inositovora NRRL Y-12698]ODQ80368.1 hypothetical protein BABINDRAFT_132774 [Babjeviella inositovora NRRL Y-12698]
MIDVQLILANSDNPSFLDGVISQLDHTVEGLAASLSDPALLSEESLRSQLQSPACKLNVSLEDHGVNYNQLALQDEELEAILQSLNRLWLIKGLSTEVQGFLDQNELLSSLHYLSKLISKNEELQRETSHQTENLLIASDLSAAISGFKKQAVAKLAALFDQFIILGNTLDCHFFSETITNHELETQLSYIEYLEILEEHKVLLDGDATIDGKFTAVADYFKTQILLVTESSTKQLALRYSDSNDDEMILEQLSAAVSPEEDFNQYVSSIGALIKFVGNIPRVSDAVLEPLIHSLNASVAKHISQIVLNSSAAALDKLVNSIRLMWSRQIDHLVKTTKYLTEAPDLKIVTATDDAVYHEIYADVKLASALASLEGYFSGVSAKEFNEEELVTVDGTEEEPRKPPMREPTNPAPVDEWDNGAWDEEIAFDDDEPAASEPVTSEPVTSEPAEDGWDWNEELDLDEAPKTKPRAADGCYKTTYIPENLFALTTQFAQESLELFPLETITANSAYLLKLILMLSGLKYPNKIVLYNDLKHLRHLLVTSGVMMDTQVLGDQLTQILNAQYDRMFAPTIQQVLAIDFEHLLSNPHNATKRETLSHFLRSELSSRYEAIAYLNPLVADKLEATFINNLHALLIQKITSMVDISEEESEELSRLIDECLENLPVPESQIQHLNKLRMLKYILLSHLKDIMERFYNSDFFEFETSELNGLLKSLFMESELRSRSIQDIWDIRQAD